MRIKELVRDILTDISMIFLILYLCLLLSIFKLLGISLEDD